MNATTERPAVPIDTSAPQTGNSGSSGCSDPKNLPLDTQIAYVRRQMVRQGLAGH